MRATDDRFPAEVLIREVSMRDGLQSEQIVIDPELRATIIDRVAAAGFRAINAASFVNPARVPQMAGAETVMAAIHRVEGVQYDASVPNLRGAQRALGAGVDALSIFVATTDAANRRNVGMSVEGSMHEVSKVVALAGSYEVPVIGSIVNAFGCPYEGSIAPDAVENMAQELLDRGCSGILLGDTTGRALPTTVTEVAGGVLSRLDSSSDLCLHLHDTRGAGLANVLAALHAGVTMFDSSLAGLGGCPFIKGASGNIVTEDLVAMLEGMGISTGLDWAKVIELAKDVAALVDHEVPSNMLRASSS